LIPPIRASVKIQRDPTPKITEALVALVMRAKTKTDALLAIDGATTEQVKALDCFHVEHADYWLQLTPDWDFVDDDANISVMSGTVKLTGPPAIVERMVAAVKHHLRDKEDDRRVTEIGSLKGGVVMTEKEAYELIEREEAAASLMEDKFNALCAAHDSYCDGDGEQFTTRDKILRELMPARDDWYRAVQRLIRAQKPQRTIN
jgi:hypothetical protein